MNSVNQTLYIPLYGKSYVSKKGLFLDDKKAEEIWEAEKFPLKGKAKSKWLAYYMGIRSAVFDSWLKEKIAVAKEETAVIHIGCGMDSRVLRVGAHGCKWYDVDFTDVIKERKRYYSETEFYKMLTGDARKCDWLNEIREKHAIIVMEGVSMYLTSEELRTLMAELGARFETVSLLADCYTVLAAKMSKYKNPVREVGVTRVYGIDEPALLQNGEMIYLKEHIMIPQSFINELRGTERFIFSKLYAGGFSKKLYRLFEYAKA